MAKTIKGLEEHIAKLEEELNGLDAENGKLLDELVAAKQGGVNISGETSALLALNVNKQTEKKGGLTYLSWAWAWTEFLKVFPGATYSIVKSPAGLPYFADATGAVVFTTVTAGGVTREMWLPVMDGANKAMKSESYTYTDRYRKEKTVEAYTMFDINKTVMRCLTKNLAMFGLGLYIYAGEDLPEVIMDGDLPPGDAPEGDLVSKGATDTAIGVMSLCDSLEALQACWKNFNNMIKAKQITDADAKRATVAKEEAKTRLTAPN